MFLRAAASSRTRSVLVDSMFLSNRGSWLYEREGEGSSLKGTALHRTSSALVDSTFLLLA